MNILLTGGTGLIGSAFIKHTIAKKTECNFTVLTRNIRQAQQKLPKNLDFIVDLAEISLADYDVVINLAGEPIVDKRWSENQKQLLCESRWQLTQMLVDKINRECSEDSPIRFISGSAVGIYGRQNDQVIDESYEDNYPEFSHHLCRRWEEIALQAGPAQTVLLRTGIVLSPTGGALGKMLLPFKLGLGGKVASGQQYMPWIHIDDMVAIIDFLIHHPVIKGPINCTAPNPVDNQNFCKTLASALNRPCLFPMPEFVLRIMFGESADLLVYGQNVVPQKLLASGFEFKYPELQQAFEAVLK